MSTVPAITLHAARLGTVAHDDLIRIEALESADIRVVTGDDSNGRPWSAKLYLWAGELRPPSWLEFLRDGFSTDREGVIADIELPDSAQSRAVVVIQVFYRTDRFYALTFGAGRYQLKAERIEPGWGLRTALNGIYASDDEDVIAECIRQIEMRTVAANTMRTLRQANRSAPFDAFGHDSEADQLNAIVGKLEADAGLGTQVKGSKSLRLARRSSFDEIPELCQKIASLHEKDTYHNRFAFVDDIREETEADTVEQLTEALVEQLNDDPGDLGLSSPSILDFDSVASYRVSIDGLDEFEMADLALGHVIDAMEDAGLEFSIDMLRQSSMEAIDEEGHIVETWSLVSTLDGQFELNDVTYVLDGGAFFRVALEFLDALDDYMDGIEESDVDLPESVRVDRDGVLKEITEGDYNEIAANHRGSHYLMDKELVRIPGKTSAIEICDVLTLDKQLVHVKRKFSSGSLSHLFAQGLVSGDLLVSSPEFLQAAHASIDESDGEFRDLFNEGLEASEFEVVYVVVGDWWDGDRELRDLPFFSKVNLRKAARSLRILGYSVTFAKVEVVDP